MNSSEVPKATDLTGEEMRRLRHMRGWSQATLAKRARVPVVVVSRIENGRDVSKEWRCSIMQALAQVKVRPDVIYAKRGFAAMDPSRQREIAALGGSTAQKQGRGHRFTIEEARLAGQRGGVTISANRAHMAELGRRGYQARARNVAERVAKGPSGQ